jgi:hypothetical protein
VLVLLLLLGMGRDGFLLVRLAVGEMLSELRGRYAYWATDLPPSPNFWNTGALINPDGLRYELTDTPICLVVEPFV